jgi:hypothetical protein
MRATKRHVMAAAGVAVAVAGGAALSCARDATPAAAAASAATTPIVESSAGAPARTSAAVVDASFDAPATSRPAAPATDPIVWKLATPGTTLPFSARGTFELWIVARNAGAATADTRRDALEFLVAGQPSMMLAMAFGNGAREQRWAALSPGDSVQEARGSASDPAFGTELFPSPGAYDFALRQDGRVVASLRVHVTP